MSNFVILSPSAHKHIKVITEHGEAYGDNVKFAVTYPLEFRNIQSSYPIFFSKSSETGEFFPIALLGFEDGENLFLSDSGWDATYIPMMMKRQPFLIGYQASSEDEQGKKPVVSIDMDSPRVSEDQGQMLFDENDLPTDFLKSMMSNLEALHLGYEHNKGFVSALTAVDLLEPFTLEITLDNGSNNQLLGFYTINEQKLLELDGETLGELNAKGYLQPIYMAVASYARIRALIDKKNALLS
jgi:hypothetical protein